MSSLSTKNKPAYVALNFMLFFTVLFIQLVLAGRNRNLIYVALGISMMVCIKSSEMELLCATMFLLPNNTYINFGGTSIITIMVTFYFVKAVLFKKTKIYFPLLILSMMLVIYSLFFWFTKSNLRPAIEVIKNFLYIFFCLEIFTDTSSSLEDKYINGIRYLVKGLIFSSILSIVINPNPNIFSQRFVLSPDQTPNTIGILSGFAIGCILMITQTNDFKVTKVWSYTMIPLAVIGFMSQSRSFVFPVLIAFVWILFFKDRKLSRKGNYRLLVFLVIGVALYLVLKNMGGNFPEVVSITTDRIINPKGGDISSGRFRLWSHYLNEIKSDGYIFFFGSGSIISPNNTLVAHNMWLEQWYQFGIIGNILIALTFWISISYIRRENGIRKLSLYGFLPLIMFLAASFFSHTFVGSAETIRFFLAIIAIYVFTEKKNQKNSNYNCKRYTKMKF